MCNAQPVLANAAVSSAGGHYIRVNAPGMVAVPRVSAPMVVTPPVIVNATVSSAGGHQIRPSAPGIQTRLPLAEGHNVVIKQSGSQISVPLQVLQSMLQAGKFFCQFFGGVFFAKNSSNG